MWCGYWNIIHGDKMKCKDCQKWRDIAFEQMKEIRGLQILLQNQSDKILKKLED
jgi:hypothetical protein